MAVGNSINETTTGICGFTGTAFTGSPATQYTVQVGGATTSALVSIGPGTAGQILQSGGNAANPAYSTATYPSTAGTSGNVLTSDGTNWLSSPASGGTVTSVSGTTNRITSTGGATPVIDISASYVGQSSITTLGTITTGVWNGSVIDLSHGGTNANLTASNGGIFYSTASAGAILAGTSTSNKVLMSGASTTPSWSTPTYPTTAGTSGNVLTSDGTNWTSAAPSGGGVLTVRTILTSAQIKALHATPIQVVATPGSGKFLVPINFSRKFIYGGSNVFVAGASQTIDLYYGTTLSAGNPMVTNAVLTSSSNNWTYNSLILASQTTSLENLAFNLYNSNATEISGNAANDNSVEVTISYYVFTL